MIEIEIRKEDEFIKLGQALKKAGLVESELVSYNGETVKIVR